jgi:hypothetical protein
MTRNCATRGFLASVFSVIVDDREGALISTEIGDTWIDSAWLSSPNAKMNAARISHFMRTTPLPQTVITEQ